MKQRDARGTRLLQLSGHLLLVLVLVALGYYPLIPSPALPTDADAAVFSADRAFEHIEAIARRPRPIGSAANAEARAYILATLRDLGVEVRTQRVSAPDWFGSGAPVDVVNVIGRIPGTRSTRAAALMAHYDTVPHTAGANDNAAAVAALLEAARALRSGPPVANDILLLFTDGEEPAPRHGARALVADEALRKGLGFVVNFEAAGGAGASLLVETGGPSEWVVERFADAGSRPAAFSMVTAITALMGDAGTDFDAFRNAGVPGLHLAYVVGSPIYHTAADDIASVSRRSLQHHGVHALALARELGGADLKRGPEPGAAVFFTLGPWLARYPERWCLPLLVLAMAVFLWGLLRRPAGTVGRGVVGTLARLTVAGAGGLVAGTAVWMAVMAVRTTPAIGESYAYMALVSTVSIVAARWLARRLLQAVEPVVVVRATLLLWLVLAAATSIWLRGASYVFVWPTLAAACALGWRGDRWQPARLALVAAPALLLAVPPIDFFFQMSLPRPGNLDSQLIAAVVVPLLLVLMVAALLRGAWPTRAGPQFGSPHSTHAAQ